MQFIKYHWFGFTISLFVCFFLTVFALVLAAPHQDLQKRGFVPCTEKMAEDLQNCQKQSICVLQSVINNTFCNIRVIAHGMKLWLKGKQIRPWSNYLFEPQISTPKITDDFEAEESLEEYYKNSPDISLEMLKLYKLNQQLENVENE